jgi:hypothetical protein
MGLIIEVFIVIAFLFAVLFFVSSLKQENELRKNSILNSTISLAIACFLVATYLLGGF